MKKLAKIPLVAPAMVASTTRSFAYLPIKDFFSPISVISILPKQITGTIISHILAFP